MSAEALHVLQMLSEGKLTVDEADELLAVLDKGELPTTPARPARRAGSVTAAHRVRDNVLLPNLTLDQLTTLKAVGVKGEYIAAMRDAFDEPLEIGQLIQLKSVGVDPKYVAAMRDCGLADLTVDQLVALKSVGVKPDYVEALWEGQQGGVQCLERLPTRRSGCGAFVVVPQDDTRLFQRRLRFAAHSLADALKLVEASL